METLSSTWICCFNSINGSLVGPIQCHENIKQNQEIVNVDVSKEIYSLNKHKNFPSKSLLIFFYNLLPNILF